MPDFKFIGFHQKATEYYGAKCSVCGDTMERGTKCMYSGITKEFRHMNCHFDHPDNLTEVWLVEFTETHEERLNPRRAVVHMDTLDRERSGHTRDRKLIRMLASYPKSFTDIIPVMEGFRAELGMARKFA